MPLRSCLIKYVLTDTGNQGHSFLLLLVIIGRASSPQEAINLWGVRQSFQWYSFHFNSVPRSTSRREDRKWCIKGTFSACQRLSIVGGKDWSTHRNYQVNPGRTVCDQSSGPCLDLTEPGKFWYWDLRLLFSSFLCFCHTPSIWLST